MPADPVRLRPGYRLPGWAAGRRERVAGLLAPPAPAARFLSWGAALLTVPLATAAGWGRPHWWALLVLAIAVALAELAAGPLGSGRERRLSLTDGAVAAAVVLAPGGWLVVSVALGVLAAQGVRRQPPIAPGFDVARLALATATAAGVAVQLSGGVAGAWRGGVRVAAAVAGMLAFWLVNHLLTVAAEPRATGRRRSRRLWADAPAAAMHSAAASSLGLLVGWLALHQPAGLLGLVVPVVLLVMSYDSGAAAAAEGQLFAELAGAQQRSSGGLVDVSAQAVLTAAARVFGAAEVEMVLLGADGAVRYAGDLRSVTRRRVDSDAFDQPWVLQALGTGGISTGTVAGRPYCSAAVGSYGDPTRPLAVLMARRPPGGIRFGRRDVRLVGRLVELAEPWLSPAGPTMPVEVPASLAEIAGAAGPGGLGPQSGPALTLLRDSAHRLSSLAAGPNGSDPVGEIVEELHAVERAVASLLGGLAMATALELADRVEVSQADPSPAQRAAQEWTTTGMLHCAEAAS